ncbi:trigger factor [Candidatus Uhrbacteria bacterium]|nr:trigger factor [Candidatus Uhrbacteria bacterium]
MPSHTLEHLSKTKVKICVTIPVAEQQPYLDHAAAEISKEAKIDGFRPGFAPYTLVAAKVGEAAVLEHAIEKMVRATFVSVVVSEGLATVGTPDVNVTKAAPGNDVTFEATVGLMPSVLKVAEWKTFSRKAALPEVTEKELEGALKELSWMQTKEVRAATGEGAGEKDKVVVDLSMKKDGVPIEGGEAKGSVVIMEHDSYLPGLREHLSQTKEGEEKNFSLTFPTSHHNKQLAGSPVEVRAVVREIFHLEHPALDDAFAVSLGMKDLESLRAHIRENITLEKTQEERAKRERALLEELAKTSEFDEIPEALINDELQKMVGELRRHVTENGLEFNDYLASLKKTLGELLSDLRPQAETRVKIALLLREIAREEGVTVDAKVLDAELDRQAQGITDASARERLYSDEYREYQEVILRNRQTIDMLCKTVFKETETTS